MSDFFDMPEVERESEPDFVTYRPPVWAGPPHGTMPSVVALDLQLGKSDAAAVALTHAEVFPAGVMLALTVVVADDVAGPDPLLFGGHHRPGSKAALDAAARMLRLGVLYPDGTKVTNLAGQHLRAHHPPQVVLGPGSGGGGGGRWSQRLWLWPLPSSGGLTVVCEWPEAAIAQRRTGIDAQTLQDAAARAREYFPDTRPEAPPISERSGS